MNLKQNFERYPGNVKKKHPLTTEIKYFLDVQRKSDDFCLVFQRNLRCLVVFFRFLLDHLILFDSVVFVPQVRVVLLSLGCILKIDF